VRGAPVLFVPRQGCLEEDAHELGPAPGSGGGRASGLGAERRWPEPRRIEPRRPPRVFFPSFVLMVNNTIQVPRFRLESRCSHRRRVVVKVVVIVIRGDGTSAARPLLGKKENLTLSRFALSSAHRQNDLYGQHDARAPDFFMLGRLPATRSAFHPMGFAPKRRQALDCRPRKTPAAYRHPRSRLWLVAGCPTHNKSARPMSWGHPEQVPTSGHPRATPTRGALA
jgi:hypothetical protein